MTRQRSLAIAIATILALAALIGATGCTVVGFSTPYNKGIEAYRAGRLNQAAEHFRQASEADPKFADAWYNLGRVYDELALATRDRLDALEREAARLASGDGVGGSGASDNGDNGDSGNNASNASSGNNAAGSAAAAGNNAGSTVAEIAALQAQIAEWRILAEDAYINTLDVRPTHAEARICLAMFIYDDGHGDVARARSLLTDATTRERGVVDRAFPQTALGFFLFKEGALDEAEAAYRRALVIEPDSAMAYYRIGELFNARAEIAINAFGGPLEASNRSRRDAITALREAVRLDGEDWVARALLGRTLWKAAKELPQPELQRDAATQLALAAARARAEYDVLIDAAVCLMELGYNEEALPWLQDAKRLITNDAQVLREDATARARHQEVWDLLRLCHQRLQADAAREGSRVPDGG